MSTFADLMSDFNQAFYSDDFPLQEKLYAEIISRPEYKEEITKSSNKEFLKYKLEQSVADECMSYIRGNDWEVVRETPDVKIESRESASQFFTKSSVLIDSNIFYVLAVLSEADLTTSW